MDLPRRTRRPRARRHHPQGARLRAGGERTLRRRLSAAQALRKDRPRPFRARRGAPRADAAAWAGARRARRAHLCGRRGHRRRGAHRALSRAVGAAAHRHRHRPRHPADVSRRRQPLRHGQCRPGDPRLPADRIGARHRARLAHYRVWCRTGCCAWRWRSCSSGPPTRSSIPCATNRCARRSEWCAATSGLS